MRLARALLLASLFATVSLAGDTPAVPEAAPGVPQLNAPPGVEVRTQQGVSLEVQVRPG